MRPFSRSPRPQGPDRTVAAPPDPAGLDRTPYRTIWRLAWPQVLMSLSHFLIGAVDVWAAGRIDASVQASLGQVTQLLLFLMVVAMAAANGAAAAISQSVGAGQRRRVSRYIGLCLELALASSLAIVLVCLAGKGGLMDLLQTPERIRPVTAYFLDVYVLTLPAYYLLLMTNAIFRAQKLVLYPLYCMSLVTVLNTVGDLGLGLGWWGLPDMGYAGLAWSTFGSILAASLLNLVILRRKGMLVRTSFAPWRWVRRAAPYLFKVAWPAGLMSLIWNAAYMVLYALAAGLPTGGEAPLAGLAVGNRIEAILFLPAFGFNLTAGILTGHFLGARQPAQAKSFGWRILALGVPSISLLTLGVWFLVPALAAFFAGNAQVAAEARLYLYYNLACTPFTVVSMILAGALAGAGATLYNLVSLGVSAWLVRIPLAWWLGYHTPLGSEGLWMAMFASQVLQSAIALYMFGFRPWCRFSLYAKNTFKEVGHGPHPAQIRACKP